LAEKASPLGDDVTPRVAVDAASTGSAHRFIRPQHTELARSLFRHGLESRPDSVNATRCGGRKWKASTASPWFFWPLRSRAQL